MDSRTCTWLSSHAKMAEEGSDRLLNTCMSIHPRTHWQPVMQLENLVVAGARIKVMQGVESSVLTLCK